jgi:hypothetical protein
MTTGLIHTTRLDEKFPRSEFRHNPYIGTFQRTRGGNTNNTTLPSSSPHVGTFRHAPTIGSSKEGLKTCIKDDKLHRRPFISTMKILQKRSVNIMALKNLPLSFFTTKDTGEDTPLCAICLDAFQDGDELRNLNCSHCFHRKCVDIWLLGTLSVDIELNGTCPTCRRNAASSSPKIKSNGNNNHRFCFSTVDSVNMSDLSIQGSISKQSLVISDLSSSEHLDEYDFASVIQSPAWSNDAIFHYDMEEHISTEIGNILMNNISSNTDIQLDSIHSSFEGMIPLYIGHSQLNGIQEDEYHNDIEILEQVVEEEENEEEEEDDEDDDIDVISIITISTYSDCGIPVTNERHHSDEHLLCE